MVAAAIEASTDTRGRINDVILTVASYGRRVPSGAQVPYAEVAALEIEQADLGAYGWVHRWLETSLVVAGRRRVFPPPQR